MLCVCVRVCFICLEWTKSHKYYLLSHRFATGRFTRGSPRNFFCHHKTFSRRVNCSYTSYISYCYRHKFDFRFGHIASITKVYANKLFLLVLVYGGGDNIILHYWQNDTGQLNSGRGRGTRGFFQPSVKFLHVTYGNFFCKISISIIFRSETGKSLRRRHRYPACIFSVLKMCHLANLRSAKSILCC
jgi:hypothetical protein